MSVTVCLPLFGEPGRELGEGAAVTPRHLRDLAVDLTARLETAAATLEKLTAAGWTTKATLFDVLVFHSLVRTREDAFARLKAADVDPEQLLVVEDVDEELDGF